MWSFKVNRRVVAQVQGSAMKMYPFLFGNCLGSFWFWFFRAVSTFWIANPNNNLIENAVAGAQVKPFNGRTMLCLQFPNILHLFIDVRSIKFLVRHKIWICISASVFSVKKVFAYTSPLISLMTVPGNGVWYLLENVDLFFSS